jgi:outer membrane protein OmpA-like peptidoglycan-associated protein/uncharacterized protein YidB (DUF937 family)
MFDILIREVAARFGLGKHAGWILSALLGLMFKKTSGGLGGFLDIFKQKGLSGLASSWLGGANAGTPLAINATQLENAIGGGLIGEIISKTGLGKGPVGMALAFMLPKIVRGLTADGNVPTGIPAAISQYLGGDDKPAAAPAPPPPAPEPPRGGFPWWLILIPLVLLLGWCMMRKPAQQPAEPPKAEAPAPAAKANAKLALGWDADTLSCNGTVDSDASKSSIMEALKNGLGMEPACELMVDANTGTPSWLSKLAEFLPLFKLNGVKLGFDGDDVSLEGANLPADGLNALVDKLKALFGDKFKSMAAAAAAAAAPAPEPAPAPVQDPGQKLEEMAKAGNVSGEDLVQALNMATINFATGSAQVSADSMGILEKAAAAIKAAAGGTKIEVGGHTDNVGNAASNMKLSAARASAVVAALVKMGVDAGMLTAKGYGDTQPKAGNDTPDGRAINRRMEFTLQ